ncbi:MAG: hypothetical protein NTV94_07020 [Planctomycetota bacterium]|nr:hypothetical protein [Planctomycetota bacterium]
MSPGTKFFVGATAVAVVLGAAAAVAWQLQSLRTSTYTDGDRITVPAAGAPLRSILWQPAREVPGAINTSADEYEPRISADSSRMIFVRGKPGANADLFESRWTTDGWSAPVAVAGVNSANDELGPELSRDGALLYFYSDRPGGVGGFDLWVARADGTGWHEPENLGASINSDQNEYGPALSLDGSLLYFSSNRLRPGEPQRQRDAWTATLRQSNDRHDYDLYCVTLGTSGSDQPGLITTVSTPFDEGSPCVSPAGDFLYFASDRPGGNGGFDLYRARLLPGKLGTPESLGSAINSPANELDPGLSMDGFRLCFSSSRPSDDVTQPHDDAKAVDYGLWMSNSREVYLRADPAAANAALLALLRECLPWLMLLLPLIALILLLRNAKFRSGFWKLSLLAQCLLISLVIHAGVASMLAVWKVGSRVSQFLTQGGGNRVILASDGVSDAAMMQVTGDLSEPLDSPTQLASSPAALETAPMQAATVVMNAAPSQVEDRASPLESVVEGSDRPAQVGRSAAAIAAAIPQAQRLPADDAPAAPTQEVMLVTPDLNGSDSSRPAVAPASVGASHVELAPQSGASQIADGAAVNMDADASEPSVSRREVREIRPVIAERTAAAAVRLPGEEAPKAAHTEDAPAMPVMATGGSSERFELKGAGVGSVAAAAHVEVAPVSAGERATDSARVSVMPSGTLAEPASSTPVIGAMPRAVSGVAGPGGAEVRMPAVEPEPKPLDTLSQRAPESRDELVKRMGGSAQTERAVGLALEWLSKHQSSDGRWSGMRFDEGHEASGGAAEVESDAAMTGLSLLCFLGAGHTHLQEGPYQAHVKRALDWLVARQRADGDLRRDAAHPERAVETMYSHNIATVALCEAFAMTRDPKLTQPTRRAIAFMVSIQANPDPSRRAGRARAEDTSVIGWQVMAMHSARRSGFAVPREAFDAAGAWLDSVESSKASGRYAYAKGQVPSAAMTAEAMFIRQLLGHGNTEPRMGESAEFVLATPPRWADGAPTHYWYYATLAMFQHQGESWRAWNGQLVPELLAHQHQAGAAAGTWDPKDEWSRLGGRIYQTAICTLSLEIYYRYKAPPTSADR